MKLLRHILIVAGIMTANLSCDSQDSVNGSLLVKLKSEGRTISQSTIYLKAGTSTNPNIPLDKYDFVQRADGMGDAYFTNLSPGDYFIYATGFDQELHESVHGESTLTIVARHRQNRYDVTIDAIF